MRLFTKGTSNPKINKSEKDGRYSTLILHLAPAKESGYEVCASRSAGCTAACLNTAGRGRSDMVQRARIARTKLWMEQRDEFKNQITKEITAHVKRCEKNAKLPAVRMNGTSDIVWESQWPELMGSFPSVQFYDYTKHAKRCLPSYQLPPNYHLTFSRSECNDSDVQTVLNGGKVNVAVVFESKNHPESWKGFPVYCADETDLRFLDPPGGHIGALYAKGKGKRDDTGFVVQLGGW